MPVIADIRRIMTETLTLGPLLLNMTGNGSRLGKAKSLSSVLAVALKEQADTIRSVQNDTSLCPAAPALCGALNASQLDLNVDFNEASDSFLGHNTPQQMLFSSLSVV